MKQLMGPATGRPCPKGACQSDEFWRDFRAVEKSAHALKGDAKTATILAEARNLLKG